MSTDTTNAPAAVSLDTLSALANAATKGPWISSRGYEQEDPGAFVHANGPIVVCDDQEPTPEDADFIAAAREGVPALVALVTRQRAALEVARHALTTLHGLVAHDGEAPGETFPIDETATIATIDAALSGEALTPPGAPQRPSITDAAIDAARERARREDGHVDPFALAVELSEMPGEGAAPTARAWVSWPTSEGFWWQRLRRVPRACFLVRASRREGQLHLVVESHGTDYADIRSASTEAAMEFTPARVEEPPR